jgi:hypothetical protein
MLGAVPPAVVESPGSAPVLAQFRLLVTRHPRSLYQRFYFEELVELSHAKHKTRTRTVETHMLSKLAGVVNRP